MGGGGGELLVFNVHVGIEINFYFCVKAACVKAACVKAACVKAACVKAACVKILLYVNNCLRYTMSTCISTV